MKLRGRSLVLVSGGTAKNKYAEGRISDTCRKYKIGVVHADVSSVCQLTKIAKATALVITQRLTVDEFFQRDPDIAVQLRYRGRDEAPIGKTSSVWRVTAQNITDKRNWSYANDAQFYKAQLPNRGWYNVKLICRLFAGGGSSRFNVHQEPCYDLVHLHPLYGPGGWHVRLTLASLNGLHMLVWEEMFRGQGVGSPTPLRTPNIEMPVFMSTVGGTLDPINDVDGSDDEDGGDVKEVEEVEEVDYNAKKRNEAPKPRSKKDTTKPCEQGKAGAGVLSHVGRRERGIIVKHSGL
ncbi:hypothetical protein B0T16DRAFT_490788 [Cercophora newfieldiana]|uniref:Uncharacterized protein n=1 Tax=Cercophora newfieldiana TaxID=92897 RepID=A0AA39YI53_9PEZI|nr:hypothetical protein B0T16DRAFT_490788 [Cercophora newfieldiana]